MVIMGVSGLVIWWPRPGRWAAAFKVARGAKGVRMHRELHGAVGIWGLIVFVIVSITGVYLGFPETMGGLLGVEVNAPPPKVESVKDAQPLDADSAVAIATGAMPGGRLRSLGLPAPAPPAISRHADAGGQRGRRAGGDDIRRSLEGGGCRSPRSRYAWARSAPSQLGNMRPMPETVWERSGIFWSVFPACCRRCSPSPAFRCG